jgi:hypothetical protein
MAAGGGQQMRLESLDVQSLNQLKERITGELQSFARSASQLSLAASKFEESRQSVEQLAATKAGKTRRLCTPAAETAWHGALLRSERLTSCMHAWARKMHGVTWGRPFAPLQATTFSYRSRNPST